MKNARIIGTAIALVICLLLAGCSGNQTPTQPVKPSSRWFTEPKVLETTSTFEAYEYYLLNEVTDRHIYSVETKPAGLEPGEKVPVVIYVHGQSGFATNFKTIYKKLATDKIAAFSFECCGGNRSEAKSEGGKLFPANYTSRMTDLETVIAKVKTLDYVDTDRIYLFGESYGGVVCSLTAIKHNEIPGIILVSTGISDGMMSHEEGDPTYLAEYDYENPLEAIKGYTGDVICFNGQQDFAHDNGKNQIDVYNERETGTAVFYSLENSDHSYSALSDEAKVFVVDTMRAFILGENP